MRKLLTLILLLCTAVLFAEMRGGAQYDPGAVRSDLTNIASGSALGVANGGTGATTAAAGLSALGGASLNGSSTVAFNALTINGVTPLTSVEKTQALVGSSTVDFSANVLSVTTGVSIGTTYPWITGGVASATFGNNGVLIVQKYNGDALVVNDYDQFDLYISNRTNSQNGKFWVDGVGTTTEIHDPGAIFSNTKDNPGTINVYIESFSIRIQNKTGATKSVKVFVEGFDE